jgi:hypothetical protein
MTLRRIVAAAAGAMLAAAACSAAAVASPGPSCLGVAIEDAAGDHAARFQGATVSQTGPNTDLVRAYFTLEKGVAYAHMAFTDLSRDMPAEVEGIVWMMRWKNGAADNWVAADLFRDGSFFFSFGHYEGTTLVEDGRHEGEFGAGPGGEIRIPIPAGHGGKAGITMTDPWVRVYVLFGGPGVYPANLTADRGPDEAFGRTTTLSGCEPGTATVPEPPRAPAARERAPAIELLGPRTVAARSRRVTFRVQAGEPLTAVRARLRRGARAIASARVARISGTGRLVLRARRPLRRGTYRLEISGAAADGRRRSAAFRVRAAG